MQFQFNRRLFGASMCAALLAITSPVWASTVERKTPEQAQEMVDRAIALYEEKGLDHTVAAIENPENAEFHDGELYVTITGMDGVLISHGVSPRLNGKNFMKIKDVAGKSFVKEYVELMAGQTSGEISFRWKNPATDEIERKRFFMRRAGDSPIFGVGVYTPNQ